MIELRPMFEAGLVTVLNVATLRALPIACAFQASERASLGTKTLSLTAFSIVLLLSVRISGFDAERTLSAYAYLLSASLILFRLGRTTPSLCAHLVVFEIVPALLWPANWMVSLLGWDVALSSYSYCAEVDARQRALRRYLFFVFVNPTVAYPARGQRVAAVGPDAKGALRGALGLLGLMLSGAITAAAADGEFALVARLGSLYLAHTGLASLQIGLMRQLGYVVPERYRGVWSARTPAQFWTRWNSYFAIWAKRYVYSPSVTWLRALRLSRLQANALAVLATFCFMGALHDLYAYARTGTPSAAMLAWFAVNAVLIMGWHWAGRLLQRSSSGAGRALRAPARTLVFASSVCVLAAILP